MNCIINRKTGQNYARQSNKPDKLALPDYGGLMLTGSGLLSVGMYDYVASCPARRYYPHIHNWFYKQ